MATKVSRRCQRLALSPLGRSAIISGCFDQRTLYMHIRSAARKMGEQYNGGSAAHAALSAPTVMGVKVTLLPFFNRSAIA